MRAPSWQQLPVQCAEAVWRTAFDVYHSQEEDRWLTLGIERVGSLLVVVHTFHQVGSSLCNIRIVSARPATRSEARQYREENL